MENVKSKVYKLISEYKKYEEDIREIEANDREYKESSGDYFACFAVRNQVKMLNRIAGKIKRIFRSYPELSDDYVVSSFLDRFDVFLNDIDFEYVSDDFKFVVGHNNIIDSCESATLDNFVSLVSEGFFASVCPISDKGYLELVSYLEVFPFLICFCDENCFSDFDFSRFYRNYEDYMNENMLLMFDDDNVSSYFGSCYSGYPDDDFCYDDQNEYDVWKRVIRR